MTRADSLFRLTEHGHVVGFFEGKWTRRRPRYRLAVAAAEQVDRRVPAPRWVPSRAAMDGAMRLSHAYYNENEPYAVQWLRNLIAAGRIAPGDVDERSVTNVPPTTCEATHNAISSPASADGPTPSTSLDGPTTDLFGQEVAPASPSQPPAKAQRSMTTTIFRLNGFLFMPSAALQSSLESRLKRRLDGVGSILFSLIWRAKATPAGWPYCQLAASARRTSDSDCGSWPTPMRQNSASSGAAGYSTASGRHSGTTLTDAARAAWPTQLTGWATPVARDAGGTPEQFLARKEKAKANGARLGVSLTSLSLQAHGAVLTGWATPAARDFKSHEGTEDFHNERLEQTRGKPLSEQAHGAISSGSPAPMEKPGQLNPQFSLWLMGYPKAWAECAPPPLSRSRKK